MSGRGPSRLFRTLIHLYPRDHRARFGAEMLEAALHAWERRGGRLVDGLAGAADLIAGAAGVWRDRMSARPASGAGGWMLDVRFVTRSLRRSPGYALTTVVVLGCAVAVVASVLSYVRGTLLAEPSYSDPESVMVVWGSSAEEGQLRDVISGPSYTDMQGSIRALSPLAAFHTGSAYLMVDGRPEVLDAHEVSADFFRLLGVSAAMGRLFDERDRTSGAEQTVVVTYGFWRDRLGADPNVAGSTLSFEGDPRTVIGVLPEGFEFISPAPLYVPLRDDILAADDPGRIHYHVFGRLVPGATLADAHRELGPVTEAITQKYPPFEGWRFLVEPLHEVSVEAVRPVIVILAIAASLVLLAALVNLATLFRIRAMARLGELDVRAAMGSGRLRNARLLALETLSLAAVGSALGLAATPLLLTLIAEIVPSWVQIPDSAARVPVLQAVLDPGVLAVTAGAAVLGSLLLTLPTLRTALGRTGSSATRRSFHGTNGTRMLVAVELALATVLCLGAGLTMRSADRLLSTDVGIEPSRLLTLYFGDLWGAGAEKRTAYFREVVQQVERIPGVARAGVMGYVDFQGEDDFARIYLLDRPQDPSDRTREEWRRVDEGLFEAAGMRMVDGRGFVSTDFAGRPRAAVVNESFAARHYREGPAIGALLSTHHERYRELRIVGVVADVHSLGPAAEPPPVLYVPYQGDPRGTQGLYVRVAAGDPMSYANAVTEAIWSVDASQPIHAVTPMSALVEAWVAVPRATRALVGGIAMLAWLLSALGAFGVVAYAVRVRRAELGIRLALGASPARLETDQLLAMAPVAVVSIGFGLVVGVVAARGASAVLYGVSPMDAPSVAGAFTVMMTAALLAIYLPARRAGRIDPRQVLVYD